METGKTENVLDIVLYISFDIYIVAAVLLICFGIVSLAKFMLTGTLKILKLKLKGKDCHQTAYRNIHALRAGEETVL